MKKLLGIVVLSLLFISNTKAVPKWIDSKILEVCKVKQDIILNMNWKLDDGRWELEPIYLTKGDYISVHKKKKNNQSIYVPSFVESGLSLNLQDFKNIRNKNCQYDYN